jgi:hypothetical protein
MKTNVQLWEEIRELHALVKQQMEIIERQKKEIEEYRNKEG